jgi:hypothetical protein
MDLDTYGPHALGGIRINCNNKIKTAQQQMVQRDKNLNTTFHPKRLMSCSFGPSMMQTEAHAITMMGKLSKCPHK